MSLYCDSCGCKIIGHDNAFLCDYPVGATYSCKFNASQTHSTLNVSRLTCDKVLCRRCAIEVWPGTHLCPTHARAVQEKVISDMFTIPKEALERMERRENNGQEKGD